MDISFGHVRAIDAGVWTGTLSAANAKSLRGAPLKIAGPHVVLVGRPAWDGVLLKAPFASVSVLALGNGEAAIFLSAEAGARPTAAATATPAPAEARPTTATPIEPPGPTHAPRRRHDTGDDEAFIYAAEVLGGDMVQVARAFLARVRATYAGALRHTGGRHYIETPDNFWSVEIQPRCRAIKLVVRTNEEKLKSAGVLYENERPPSYFAMKICEDGSVERALKFLELASKAP